MGGRRAPMDEISSVSEVVHGLAAHAHATHAPVCSGLASGALTRNENRILVSACITVSGEGLSGGGGDGGGRFLVLAILLLADPDQTVALEGFFHQVRGAALGAGLVHRFAPGGELALGVVVAAEKHPAAARLALQ